MTRLRLPLAILVVVVLGVAVAGIGQGSAPASPKVSAAKDRASIARVAKGGKQVLEGEKAFDEEGCAACHTMAAGGYDGKLGPRLDVVTKGDDAKADYENIVKPRGDIAEGYEAQKNLMPADYAKRIGKTELKAISAYIAVAAGTKKATGG